MVFAILALTCASAAVSRGALPAISSTPPLVVSATLPLSAAGATLVLPVPHGFHAAITYPENDAPPGATVTFRISRAPLVSPLSLPAINLLLASLPGRTAPIAWLELTTSATVHFDPGIVEFKLTVPHASHAATFDYASVACDELACRVAQTDLPSVDDEIVAGNRHVPIRFRFTAFGEHSYIAAIFSHPPAQ